VKDYIYRGEEIPRAGSRGGDTQGRRHMGWRTAVNPNGPYPCNPNRSAPGEATQGEAAPGEAAPRGGGIRGGAPP
jgi:hypothetical protein